MYHCVVHGFLKHWVSAYLDESRQAKNTNNQKWQSGGINKCRTKKWNKG